MKGDFTRFTFDPRKRYSAVLMQQGRVQVDADWNEQLAIGTRREREEGVDVIGGCGVPKTGGGFDILPLGPGVEDFGISAGRIYVDGIACDVVSSKEAVAGFPAADAIQVASTTLDGIALAAGDWIQVSALNSLQPVLGQVSGVDSTNGIITLDRDIAGFDSIRSILDSHSRLNVFVIGNDGAVWRNWQSTPGGGWSGWVSLGGVVDMLTVGQNKDGNGRLEVFARGLDNAVWHNWETSPGGQWSGWFSMGGWIDRLAVGRNADGRLELFARGADQAVWHNWQTAVDNGWSGWNSMGGWVDLLAVSSDADGRLEVFARGSDQALYHNYQTTKNNGWNGWVGLGGWIDRLAVGQNKDGRLEVFARGSDQAVWHIWQTTPSGGWSIWNSLGGVVDLVTVATNQDGRLEVFARGTDKAVWHAWQTLPTLAWTGWSSLGGWVDMLNPASNQDGHLELFARGSDQNLYHMWQQAPNGGWNTWVAMQQQVANLAQPQLSRLVTYTTQPEYPDPPALGGQTGTGVSGLVSVVSSPDHVDMYARATGGHLIWLQVFHNSPVTQVFDLTVTATGAPVAGDPCAVSLAGANVHVLARGGAGQLVEYVWNGANWAYVDQTGVMQSKLLAGEFSAVVIGSDAYVYGRGSAGELLELHLQSSPVKWAIQDLVATATGMPLSADPVALVLNGNIHVFALGTSGQLLEYANGSGTGAGWTFKDHSGDSALKDKVFAGKPAARADGSAPHLYLRDPSGDMWELYFDSSTNQWQADDHTAEVGGTTLAGDPTVTTDTSGNVHVFARGANGDLLEFEQAAAQLQWQLFDRSGQLGATPLAADPTTIPPGAADLHVYAAAADGRLVEFRKLADPSPWQVIYHTADVPFSRTDLVYLDVWERHVTAIEDPDIRETALRGPDHATRLQVEAQVRVLRDVGNIGCGDSPPGWPPAPSGGLMSTLPVLLSTPDDPCLPGPRLAYDGLENRLYRVEVHVPGDLGAASFKWSRDNGSVVFAIDEFVSGQAGKRVRLSRLGRDQSLTIRVNDWVEVLNDKTELDGVPGTLAKVTGIDQAQRIVTLSKDVSAFVGGAHPRLRRWDQPGDAVGLDSSTKTLESNIQVQFGGGGFRTGDYWVFTARTATRDVELLTDAPPRGVEHHYCKLGLIQWTASGGQLQSAMTDCRLKFPPLTDITAGDVFVTDTCGLGVKNLQDSFNEQCNQRSLRYVSGDGQEATPGTALPGALVVGVEDGFERPVAGVSVNFTVDSGGGAVSSATVATDANGLATTTWTLGPSAGPNQVTARLASGTHLPIVFRAVGTAAAAAAFMALRYVGGDGQQGPTNSTLPCPLIVGVEDSTGRPAPAVKIHFAAGDPGDRLMGSGASGSSFDVATGSDGLATVEWQLSGQPGCHHVDVSMSSAPTSHLGIKFEADAVERVAAVILPQVAAINWTNDQIFPNGLGGLTKDGVVVDFTEDMDVNSLSTSTFIVSVDMAELMLESNGQMFGHRPFILPGVVISETSKRFRFRIIPTISSTTFGFWLLREANASGTFVRIRVRLIGDSIINAAKTRRLDGNVFGPNFGGTTNLGLPSGDGIEGGDFQSWFRLIG
jgi:hypothetical protein